MATMQNETTTNTETVVLTGFQRNGAAIIGISFHEVDHVSHVGEMFAASHGVVKTLHSYGARWRENILKDSFGMNRMPFTTTPMMNNIPLMASNGACSKIFNTVVSGGAQSDITYSLNTKDVAILCKASFQTCPFYFKVWDEMRDHPRCKVLYIRREDPIALIVSATNAYLQKQWQVVKDKKPRYDKVNITTRHMAEWLAFYDAHVGFFDSYLNSWDQSRVMTLDFDDLVYRWDEVTPDICRFIGVEEQAVERMTFQQIPDEQHLTLIANLGEHLRYFKDSRWEHYFNV